MLAPELGVELLRPEVGDRGASDLAPFEAPVVAPNDARGADAETPSILRFSLFDSAEGL